MENIHLAFLLIFTEPHFIHSKNPFYLFVVISKKTAIMIWGMSYYLMYRSEGKFIRHYSYFPMAVFFTIMSNSKNFFGRPRFSSRTKRTGWFYASFNIWSQRSPRCNYYPFSIDWVLSKLKSDF